MTPGYDVEVSNPILSGIRKKVGNLQGYPGFWFPLQLCIESRSVSVPSIQPVSFPIIGRGWRRHQLRQIELYIPTQNAPYLGKRLMSAPAI